MKLGEVSHLIYPRTVDRTSIDIQENVSLAPFTTLGVGGPASFFVRVYDEDALMEAVQFARRRGLPIFILGGGSNLLVSDEGFSGIVMRIEINSPLETLVDAGTVRYTVPGGTDWDSFVLSTCQQGLSGVECLAGIPGSVGGTPVQNVGAYGQEVSETIQSVRALDLESMLFVDLPRSTCGFSYRRSLFNSKARERYIITAVQFKFDLSKRPQLTYADLVRHFGERQPTPIEIYHAVREIRRRKGMLLVSGDPDVRSAGSFFKNPVVPADVVVSIADTVGIHLQEIPQWPTDGGMVKLSAAWLLERAGFTKGYTLGNAGISSRHSLALINRGHATAAEIFTLRDTIRAKVKALFRIDLEQEPVQLGT